MKVRLGVLTLGLLLTLSACSSSSSKVVDYDWTSTATNLRNTVTLQAKASCELSVSKAAPIALPIGASIYVKLKALDSANAKRNAALTACEGDLAPKQYADDLPRLRTQAVATVCTSTGAAKVRVTWLDFRGDRVTEVQNCSH